MMTASHIARCLLEGDADTARAFIAWISRIDPDDRAKSAYYFAHMTDDYADSPETKAAVEQAIMGSPKWAARYALYLSHERWPAAERAILTDPEYGPKYRKQFGLKESEDGADAFDFSAPSEPVLPGWIKTPFDAYRYVQHMLCLSLAGGEDTQHFRFKAAEPLILQDIVTSYKYARAVLGQRWPEAEPVIRQEPYWWNQYCKHFGINESEDIPDLDPPDLDTLGLSGMVYPYDGRYPRITTTYSIITPESAENGEFAENGWEDEDGVSMIPDEYDQEEGITVVDKAIEFLEDKGASNQGSWYSTSEEDYTYGSVTEYNYHLVDFTNEEEDAISAQLAIRERRRRDRALGRNLQ